MSYFSELVRGSVDEAVDALAIRAVVSRRAGGLVKQAASIWDRALEVMKRPEVALPAGGALGGGLIGLLANRENRPRGFLQGALAGGAMGGAAHLIHRGLEQGIAPSSPRNPDTGAVEEPWHAQAPGEKPPPHQIAAFDADAAKDDTVSNQLKSWLFANPAFSTTALSLPVRDRSHLRHGDTRQNLLAALADPATMAPTSWAHPDASAQRALALKQYRGNVSLLGKIRHGIAGRFEWAANRPWAASQQSNLLADADWFRPKPITGIKPPPASWRGPVATGGATVAPDFMRQLLDKGESIRYPKGRGLTRGAWNRVGGIRGVGAGAAELLLSALVDSIVTGRARPAAGSSAPLLTEILGGK